MNKKEQHRYHKNQTLGFKNGIPVQIRPTSGIGGERLVQVVDQFYILGLNKVGKSIFARYL